MRATTTGNEVNRVVVDSKKASFAINAQVVKLVDTPASGAGDLTVVEVRVFSWAPIQKTEPLARFFITCDLTHQSSQSGGQSCMPALIRLKRETAPSWP
jgi:hypothetical protein